MAMQAAATAAELHDPTLRLTMLSIAAGYRDLAEVADKVARGARLLAEECASPATEASIASGWQERPQRA